MFSPPDPGRETHDESRNPLIPDFVPPGRPGRFRFPAAAFPLAAAALLAACKSKTVVWQAERKAAIGGEFIRLFDDGHAEYGYGVVSEKLKAEGAYRTRRIPSGSWTRPSRRIFPRATWWSGRGW